MRWRQRISKNIHRFLFGMRVPLLAAAEFPDKIRKIHSLERECRLSLRSKTAESSEAKATAPKANVTARSFLILPSLATRKFSQILLTATRLLFSPILKSEIKAP